MQGLTDAIEAVLAGDRAEANRRAAAIDAQPAGPFALSVLTADSLQGAPFDLEATPNFKARLAESGLSWPPVSPIAFPPLRGHEVRNGQATLNFRRAKATKCVFVPQRFYAASAWLLVQVATQVFPLFHVAEWVMRWIVVASIIGFPCAIVFSWFYEWTPRGLQRESELRLTNLFLAKPDERSIVGSSPSCSSRWCSCSLTD
jgi:hypothetical protein